MTDHEPYVNVRATGRSSFFLKTPEYELSLMRWLIPPGGTDKNGGYVTWTTVHVYGTLNAQEVAERMLIGTREYKKTEWVVK